MGKGFWRAKVKAKASKDPDAAQQAQVEYSLRSLRGVWRDTKGSKYDVLVDNDTVEIRTKRPNGQVIKTRGLVHWDSKSEWIVWGRSGARSQYWLSELASSSLLWERENSAPFSWQRVSGPPQEESEPEEEAAADAEAEAEEQPRRGRGGRKGRWSPSWSKEWDAEVSEAWEAWHGGGEDEYEETEEWQDWAEKEEEDEEVEVCAVANDNYGTQERPSRDEVKEEVKRLLGVPERSWTEPAAAHVRQAEPQQCASPSEKSLEAPATPPVVQEVAPPQKEAPLPSPVLDSMPRKATDLRAVEEQLLAALREGGATVDAKPREVAPVVAVPATQQARVSGAALAPSAVVLTSCVSPASAQAFAGQVNGHNLQRPPLGAQEVYVGRLEHVVRGFLGGALPSAGQTAPAAYLQPGWPIDPRHVRDQLDYYFSDQNLFQDSYLKSFMMPEEGWVSLMLVQQFPRMRLLGADIFALRQAGAGSATLEIDGTGMYVRIREVARRKLWAPSAVCYQ